jgi:hypothetical protein
MTEIRDIDEIADELLPVDGPHKPEGVQAAAALIRELVRRLNHATLPHRADRSLRYPAVVYRTVSSLHGAAALLPQALQQLATRLEGFASTPGLYDDRYDRADTPPDLVAMTAASYLRDEAAPRADWLADALSHVCRHSSHLGLHEAGEG